VHINKLQGKDFLKTFCVIHSLSYSLKSPPEKNGLFLALLLYKNLVGPCYTSTLAHTHSVPLFLPRVRTHHHRGSVFMGTIPPWYKIPDSIVHLITGSPPSIPPSILKFYKLCQTAIRLLACYALDYPNAQNLYSEVRSNAEANNILPSSFLQTL